MEPETVDFVVIGSGAGGGPLAANLARAGYTVALLEAGGDDEPPEYSVPAFFTKATEHPDLSWNYFVRHYRDETAQRRDCKYVPKAGVLYPRSGTLGGCTAHHAMITVYPHGSDWDAIADLLGDASWSAEAMERYFTRLEKCGFLPRIRASRPARPFDRHGYDGWLPTGMGDIRFVLKDWKILRIAWSALAASAAGQWRRELGRLWRAYRSFPGGPIHFLKRYFDPTDRPHSADEEDGVYYIPVSVEAGRRAGVRHYILQTAAAHPDRLHVLTDALATRILFDQNRRATGVEYLSGKHLYAADPRAEAGRQSRGERRILTARREVILAAGAFNSPQLLKLSGVGPRGELERLRIPVVADRPGVGENLQDRYEVAVIYRTKSDFRLTRGATFRAPAAGEEPDPLYAKWLDGGRGPYATNGVILSIVRTSSQAEGRPDLIAFAVPGLFRGYFPGYSATIAQERNYFSWVILKSHVRNRAGRVVLRSADPREAPEVNFHYFQEGSPGWEKDLDALAEAVQFVRSVASRTRGIVAEEVLPGPNVRSLDEIKQFIRDEAWGHHASCSNRMGPASDPLAVVDGSFRVHGVEGLRVVDASVFPRIPGFYLVTAVYMISEKASDAIVADARRAKPPVASPALAGI